MGFKIKVITLPNGDSRKGGSLESLTGSDVKARPSATYVLVGQNFLSSSIKSYRRARAVTFLAHNLKRRYHGGILFMPQVGAQSRSSDGSCPQTHRAIPPPSPKEEKGDAPCKSGSQSSADYNEVSS